MLAADQVVVPTWSYVIPLAVAAVGAIAAIATAMIANRTKKSVGTKNGQGNLVEMNERQLRQHAEVKAELAVIKDLIVSHVTDLETHGGPYARSIPRGQRQ